MKRSHPTHGGGEEGVALILALMAVLLLSALGFALLITTSTESMIAANYRNGSEGLYAAEGALERAMSDLLTVRDWNTLLDGTTRSAFTDGPPSGARSLSDGATLDLAQAVNMANCSKLTPCSANDLTGNATGDRPWGANNPVWTLYAYGAVRDLLPTARSDSPFYAIVLVADDPAETDGNPLQDGVAASTNPGSGVLALRAEAFGPRAAHKVIEVTAARTDAAELERSVRILSWREVR
jgi:Tfp pilus assembly protein PilX